MSSVRSSPIPDLAYDSYRAMSYNNRGQNLVKRTFSNGNGHTNGGSGGPSKLTVDHNGSNDPSTSANVNFGFEPSTSQGFQSRHRFQDNQDNEDSMKPRTIRLDSNLVQAGGAIYSLEGYAAETIAFWVLLSILILLVIGNTVLTCVVFGVLRLGSGMESIEVRRQTDRHTS